MTKETNERITNVYDNKFYGNEVSNYGLKHGYIDYKCLAESFDGVLCNAMKDRLDNTMFLEYGDYVKYYNDNGDQITEEEYYENDGGEERYEDIFQWIIIDNNGYEILKYWTNELIFYDSELDVYVWGITHYGTGWDYVLTDIKIDPKSITYNEAIEREC